MSCWLSDRNTPCAHFFRTKFAYAGGGWPEPNVVRRLPCVLGRRALAQQTSYTHTRARTPLSPPPKARRPPPVRLMWRHRLSACVGRTVSDIRTKPVRQFPKTSGPRETNSAVFRTALFLRRNFGPVRRPSRQGKAFSIACVNTPVVEQSVEIIEKIPEDRLRYYKRRKKKREKAERPCLHELRLCTLLT